MSVTNADAEQIRAVVTESLRAHWAMYLVEGILLLVFGMAAVTVPPLGTIAIEIVVGWLFLFSGIVGLVATFRMRRAPGFWWSLISAVSGIVAGLILLRWPLSGTLSLTILLSLFFVTEGTVSILLALEHRREQSGRWGWMLASGLLDLVLAGIFFLGFPGTAAWAIGLVVGIDMIFGGVALIAMALYARTAAPSAQPSQPSQPAQPAT